MCYVAPRSTWLLTMLLTTRLSAGGGLSRKQRSRQKAENQVSQQQARNRNKEARSKKQRRPRARPDGSLRSQKGTCRPRGKDPGGA